MRIAPAFMRRAAWLFMLAGLAVVGSHPATAQVRLNEFLALNVAGQADEAGEHEDWVELVNTGAESVDLAGYFLTDDLSNPTTWRFPSHSIFVLAPGARLLLWLDEDPEQGPRHADFRLSANGEQLGLYLPDGATPVDTLSFGAQFADVSYGRAPDGSGAWTFLAPPTPGSANPETGVLPPPAAPVPSLAPGFYDEAVAVRLSASAPGAEIYYTLDGRVPGPASGARFDGESLIFERTTVLRAMTIAPGALPSSVLTATYFVGVSHTFPVVSLVAEPDSLFGAEDGIYMPGPRAKCPGTAAECANNRQANFWLDREPPAHAEYFDEQGSLGFSLDLGVRIFGGISSRWRPKKSFQIRPRDTYGQTRIRYRMFPDRPDIKSYDGFILRASPFDWARFRNEYIYEVNRRGGGRSYMQAWKYVALYINGAYWGVYNLMERKGADYVASNFGETDIDMLAAWREVVEGDVAAYNELLDFMNSDAILGPDGYAAMEQRIDLDNLIEYWIHDIYQGNRDNGNIRYFRPRRPDGRWRFISYDNDQSDIDHNTLAWITSNHGRRTTPFAEEYWILGRALLNETFRNRFVNRFADLLNSILLPEQLNTIYDSLAAALRPEIGKDLERWGRTYYAPTAGNPDGPYNPDNPPRPVESPTNCTQSDKSWEYELCARYTHAELRPRFVREHILEEFDLEGTTRLILDVATDPDSTAFGAPVDPRVGLNSLVVRRFPFEGIYFRGVPVTLSVDPPPGFEISGWGEDFETTDPTLTITPEKATVRVTLRLRRPDFVRAPITFNELYYDAPDTLGAGDWFELVNPTEEEISVSGWYVGDDGDAAGYSFPSETTLAPEGFLVVCEDAPRFAAVHPGVFCLEAPTLGLRDSGERLALYYPDGALADSVRYAPDPPWPAGAAGRGFSLELRNPAWDNAAPTSWWASTQRNGTPGRTNSVFSDSEAYLKEALIINEISYRDTPVQRAGDWVEFYNPSDEDVPIAGWYIRDASPEHFFFIPPETVIPAGGLQVVCENPDRFASAHPGVPCLGPLTFGFSRESDAVRLFFPDGDQADIVIYGTSPPWPTAADDQAFTLELLNYAWDNSQAESWAASLTPAGTPGAENTVFVGSEPTAGPDATGPVLEPAYPNPFGTTTTLTFSVSEARRVRIDLFDTLGRHVGALYDQTAAPGAAHRVRLHAGALPSGMYVVRARFLSGDDDAVFEERRQRVVLAR